VGVGQMCIGRARFVCIHCVNKYVELILDSIYVYIYINVCVFMYKYI